MSRIAERMIDDEVSDPMEYMDQPVRKSNRKSIVMDNYDDEDDVDDDEIDEDDEDDEEFEEEDDDE